MKITRELLTTALQPAADILRVKISSDSPRYLKVEAVKNKLTLSANDGGQSAVSEVECEGELKPLCLPFHNLQNLMPLFVENVTMESTGTNLKIRSSGNFSLNTFPTDQFTAIALDKLTKLGVNCIDLADCVDRVQFASRKEDSRVNLYGVNVKLSAKKIITEASTGLFYARMEKASIAADGEFMIPYPFVSNVVTNLRNAGAVLSVSQNKISVAFDGGCYACSLLGVPFPNNFNTGIDKGKRSKIGEFKPSEWLPIFRSIFNMSGEEGKLRCDVTIEAGRLKYDGKQGSVDTKIDKLSKKLRLNASTFIGCLEAFDAGECKASISSDDALVLEQGDLTVATTQLRG